MIAATGTTDLMITLRLSAILHLTPRSGFPGDRYTPGSPQPPEGPMVLRRQSHGLGGSLPAFALTIALLAIIVGGCAFPEEAFDGSLEGSYYVNGFDQEGTEYSGLLTITTTADPAVYAMQWIITGAVQEGTGRVAGKELVVEWDALEGYDPASYGTARYQIGDDGELRGERTVAGQEGVGTEEAFPIR
jgi:hypothetical protein